MTIAVTGTIATSHASRYLQQLCKHWSHKFTVEFTPERGRIELPGDAVTSLQADAQTLEVRIEAPDADTFARMKEVVIDHLNRFAFREAPLDVAWH